MEGHKHSGFEAPVRGTQYPKGTTFKKDKDGFLIPILPKDLPDSKAAEEKSD